MDESDMQNFVYDESGAVTVDWVVLTAAIVGLGLAVLAVTSGGVENLSEDTATELASIDPGASTFASLSNSPFDLSGWTPLGYGASAFASITAAVASNGDAVVLSQLDTHAPLAANGSSQDADIYAIAYAEAQSRNLDVSGYEDPNTYASVINGG